MQQYTPMQVKRYLREQQASGLSVSEYCHRNNVNVWTFRGWRERHGLQGQGVRMPFIRLDIPAARVVEVVTGSKAIVRIPLEADAEGLRQVLTALKRSRLVA